MTDIDKLLDIMSELRDPHSGCPWDIQQDFTSLVPFTLEEVYEVVDAIETRDYPHLCEELGDLLFQVVFYSQIAKERGLFDMSAVIDGIAAKLLVRHPHVFPRTEASAAPPEMVELHAKWEALKQKDRAEKGIEGLLGDIPVALPALQRAHKIQSRMARIGFDWHDPHDVLLQLRAEVDELEQAMLAGDNVASADELGDVLFSCVNLARHLRCDAEASLRQTNNKVTARIAWMESTLQERQQSLSGKSLVELESLWVAAKQTLSSR
jgi:ATP diphosphatase